VANRPRLFNNNTFFNSAASTVHPRQYKYYENDGIPEFLLEDQQQRIPNIVCRINRPEIRVKKTEIVAELRIRSMEWSDCIFWPEC